MARWCACSPSFIFLMKLTKLFSAHTILLSFCVARDGRRRNKIQLARLLPTLARTNSGARTDTSSKVMNRDDRVIENCENFQIFVFPWKFIRSSHEIAREWKIFDLFAFCSLCQIPYELNHLQTPTRMESSDIDFSFSGILKSVFISPWQWEASQWCSC